MARRKRTSPGRIIVGVLALFALVGAAWVGFQRLERERDPAVVSAERIEPGNDGRRVRVGGRLTASATARDGELGIGAGAAVLFRKVEMYQWRERCDPAPCSYEPVWSSLPIDSRSFRQSEGHENPPMRLADALFAGAELRLGAFSVDPELAAAQIAAVDHPVHTDELPPNLAASFSEAGGVLYAGGNSHPRVGEVRISYRIAPLGDVVLTGVQRGNRLTAQ
jgi:hypothetical protein